MNKANIAYQAIHATMLVAPDIIGTRCLAFAAALVQSLILDGESPNVGAGRAIAVIGPDGDDSLMLTPETPSFLGLPWQPTSGGAFTGHVIVAVQNEIIDLSRIDWSIAAKDQQGSEPYSEQAEKYLKTINNRSWYWGPPEKYLYQTNNPPTGTLIFEHDHDITLHAIKLIKELLS